MIGERIKERRIELEMTQEELANAMGYKSKSTINKIELCINDVPLSKVKDFAKCLKTSIAFLMEWDSDEPIRDEPTIEFTEPLQRLVFYYNELNAEGQEKILEYARLLNASGEYKKMSSDSLGRKAE